jgi:signal transduction histidine kinase
MIETTSGPGLFNVNLTERLFNRLMIGVVVLGFMALTGMGLGVAWVAWRNADFTNWVNHTYEVETRLSEFRLNLERTETARRGFLLDQDPAFYQAFRTNASNLTVGLDRVGRLTADNPHQQARLTQARALIARMVPGMEDSVALARVGQLRRAQGSFRQEQTTVLVRQLRRLTDAMQVEEAGLLQARDVAQAAGVRVLFVVLSFGGVLLLFVAVSSLWVILRYTRDLNVSRATLSVMNQGLEATVQERTADIKRANDEIQRFAYIVSHDLRSPLVNVMGFTAELDAAAKPLADLMDRLEAEAPQLLTQDVREAVRVDLPEAVGFIRSSTQKMDRLINAILRLSREGRRVISPERIDMEAMLTGVADNLRHQAMAKGAQIEVEGPVPSIVSDRLAVEQIFSNLTENAIKYLAKNRPGRVVLRGRVQGPNIVFEVQDNGRGIDPKDHERVFDLFRRSGAQDQPGEGIGLAHVRALAYRLGGLISCESGLDRGATFRLSLPKILILERGASS